MVQEIWKLDNSLLHNPDFIRTINTIIMQIKENYALPVYSRNNISTISDSDIQFKINAQLLLEILFSWKLELKPYFIQALKKRNDEIEKKIA